ncbi:hypothetical protein COO60DRAFT_923310 [Scenedesmus sp. NREL 46B-D3]|nr:hypothetical protein COO60DRAFT_923310 [Scenedesmus sp. NREL 46B-D3]
MVPVADSSLSAVQYLLLSNRIVAGMSTVSCQFCAILALLWSQSTGEETLSACNAFHTCGIAHVIITWLASTSFAAS